ncbi:transposase [Xylophilus sp. ASV27]|uniref:transposase n=1 Tax=Xylophilus sp. ASV27 TaxID=2795129 RepID=UPI004040C303
MNAAERFDSYLEHLSEGLGHVDRHAGLRGYCTGLMLPLSRKSVEPMATRVDPTHASARHQALHHFVAKAEWSDTQMLRRVCQWVMPKMDFSQGGWWIIDDTGFHHHAALSIAAYGFLMAERLVADKSVGGKKTSSNARCLPFPRITSPEAVLRAQRHVATSITTLRHRLGYQLIARLGQCPCCGRASAKHLL